MLVYHVVLCAAGPPLFTQMWKQNGKFPKVFLSKDNCDHSPKAVATLIGAVVCVVLIPFQSFGRKRLQWVWWRHC